MDEMKKKFICPICRKEVISLYKVEHVEKGIMYVCDECYDKVEKRKNK